MKGFGIGLILSSIFKGIAKLFSAVITIIAYILIYFGLWAPCVYLIYILALQLILGFNIATPGLNSILFYSGLLLSLTVSLIITIRNLIVKPVADLTGHHSRTKELKRRETVGKATKLKSKHPDKYYKKYGNIPPSEIPELTRSQLKKRADAPLVYRSSRNRSIVIHEFSDRYEVFRDCDGKLQYLETKGK